MSMAKITSHPHRAREGTGGALTRLCLNALAFSTLLSSQGTDAHHQPALAGPPGQPLNFTQSIPSCQPRLPELSGLVADSLGVSRCHRPYQSPLSLANQRESRESQPVWSRRRGGTLTHLAPDRESSATQGDRP